MPKRIVCLSFMCSMFVTNGMSREAFCTEGNVIKANEDSILQKSEERLAEEKDKANLNKKTDDVPPINKDPLDAQVSSTLQNEEEKRDFSKIKDRKELVKAINAIPEKERPSLEREELFVNEEGALACEDKIYNPRFWKMSLEEKLEYMEYLGHEAKIKVIRFFRNTEKAYALVIYTRKLFALEEQIVTLYQRTEKVLNFHEILVKSSKEKSFTRKVWDFLFGTKKDLGDEDLDAFCSSKDKNSLKGNPESIDEDYEEGKLRNILENIDDAEKYFKVLRKQYDSEFSKTLEEFKRCFPNMKNVLLDFYGKDALNKFDYKKVDFKDKKIPKEIKILANAQKVLDVDVNELLKD